MKLQTTSSALLILLCASVSAYAGKAEREFIETTMNPAVQAAAAAYKSACTGDLKIDVKVDSFKNVDELRQVRNFVNRIEESAAGYCKDKATKTVMSKLKVLEISKAAQVTVKFSGNKAVATTDESSFPSWDMLAAEIDK